jgi:hypothetical protein
VPQCTALYCIVLQCVVMLDSIMLHYAILNCNHCSSCHTSISAPCQSPASTRRSYTITSTYVTVCAQAILRVSRVCSTRANLECKPGLLASALPLHSYFAEQ